MMKAILLRETGSSEKLILSEVESKRPGRAEVLVKVIAAGVNYMDVGTRQGVYSIAELPMIPGVEGAGTVLEIGEDVEGISVGDRVAWLFVVGSYAEEIVAKSSSLVVLPDDIDADTAAGLMLQGLAASHFVSETYSIKPGDTALVHSAAGGIGLMLTQMIKILGGRVIGRVSSKEKAAIARAAGADEIVIAADVDFAREVMRLTDGEGVDVVYDGSGADTFYGSIDSLKYHGVMAYYGYTIKRLPPIDIIDLPKSILVTYPSVVHHIRTREALVKWSNRLFGWLREGKLKVNIGKVYRLEDARQAHDDLESRKTTGKLLLRP